MFAAAHQQQRNPSTQQFLAQTAQRFDRYRYETIVKPAVARTTLANFIKEIRNDRAYLADLCDKFGNTILSRWKKKSWDKREALLLRVDSTIEKEPWFRLRTEGEALTWQEVRPLRRSWLLPYMNTATLKENPSVLIGLLHNRVVHSLEQWVPFDNDLVRQGWADGFFDLEYCGSYCVVMHGVNYGKLVPWDKEAAEYRDIVGYPRARLTIEAQALMFSRLRKIVDLILEGVNRDSTGACDKWQEVVRAGFKQLHRIELWSDYTNQPFSSPPKFDVDYYCYIAKARMQAARDHLWLLQTDPSYFRRFVKVLADIHQAVQDYLRWRELNEEWSTIQDYYHRFRDSIHPGQPLPRRLELGLSMLAANLTLVLDRRVRHPYGYIAQCPGFQHLWKFTVVSKPPSSPRQQMFSMTSLCELSSYQLYREDPLYWTLTELQAQPNAPFHFDRSELFARLEAHLADASPEERARLDETVYAKMSDFAAQYEMLSAVRSHRPAFTRRGVKETRKMVEEHPTPSTRGLVRERDAVAYKSKLHAFPADCIRMFEQSTPAVGRRDEAWIDCRAAERRALNEFWEQACESLREELTYTDMNQEELEDALSVISVSSSTEYVDIVKTERLAVMDAVAAAAERAPKPKTRPSQAVDVSPSEPVSLKIDINKDMESHSPPQISATSRALEIIRKMFPSSAEETLAKDTDWDVFVHAMNDLGFNARNVGGSAVAFEHPSKKKIIFHRPHPSPKIESVMLQSMGKRMRKHFDWSRETFVGV
ncbi:unnamed protein product [Aureobasidium vineae]|uniref:Uncharacterized protein n=1 Tax=Aureobasidium vineae TaxID=2773715 RepID=A0A9N8J821_9PEZI|nr:unnamed protein product [Aureobasidium vineae]